MKHRLGTFNSDLKRELHKEWQIMGKNDTGSKSVHFYWVGTQDAVLTCYFLLCILYGDIKLLGLDDRAHAPLY
jgi:hypothetical protein